MFLVKTIFKAIKSARDRKDRKSHAGSGTYSVFRRDGRNNYYYSWDVIVAASPTEP